MAVAKVENSVKAKTSLHRRWNGTCQSERTFGVSCARLSLPRCDQRRGNESLGDGGTGGSVDRITRVEESLGDGIRSCHPRRQVTKGRGGVRTSTGVTLW